MNATETESILTLALMAGFADGAKSDAERAEFKRIAEGLPNDSIQPAALYHRVLLKQVTLAQAAARLHSPELRQLAYEMAVCVCEADGVRCEGEKRFLAELRQQLNLDTKQVASFEKQTDALAVEPLADTTPFPPSLPVAKSPAALPPEMDKMILNYAILNGALELMPQSLATMAIVPLQMKMVYRIGKSHGHELDRGHIKELLATAGLGLTSQVLEGYARKLLGGLLGKAGGGILKSVGRQAAGSAMSFATTWALGRLAHHYYSGGRTLSAIELRQLFGTLTQQASALHGQHAAAIQEQTGSINLNQLLPLIRGQA